MCYFASHLTVTSALASSLSSYFHHIFTSIRLTTVSCDGALDYAASSMSKFPLMLMAQYFFADVHGSQRMIL